MGTLRLEHPVCGVLSIFTNILDSVHGHCLVFLGPLPGTFQNPFLILPPRKQEYPRVIVFSRSVPQSPSIAKVHVRRFEAFKTYYFQKRVFTETFW